MKILIVSSRHLYHRIPQIENELKSLGHIISLPKSYDEPFREERMKALSLEDHIKFKQEMMKLQEPKIRSVDSILVLNFEKNGKKSYIGWASFMEIIKAWELDKGIYLYNPIPDNIFKDELTGINPIVVYGDLKIIK